MTGLPKMPQCCILLGTAGKRFPMALCAVTHKVGLSEPDACLACSSEFDVSLCPFSVLSTLHIIFTLFL